MANSDRPNGFTPVRHMNGNPWNGKFRMYYVPVTDGTDIFKGDTVKSAGSADSTGKYASVEQGGTSDPIRGVVIGFSDTPYLAADTTDLKRVYRPASTAMYLAVVDDPGVIWEAQEDGDGGNLGAGDVGSILDLVVGSGNTTTGLSGMELNSSDGGSTSTKIFMLLGLVDREENDLGANAKWEVFALEHELNLVTGIN